MVHSRESECTTQWLDKSGKEVEFRCPRVIAALNCSRQLLPEAGVRAYAQSLCGNRLSLLDLLQGPGLLGEGKGGGHSTAGSSAYASWAVHEVLSFPGKIAVVHSRTISSNRSRCCCPCRPRLESLPSATGDQQLGEGRRRAYAQSRESDFILLDSSHSRHVMRLGPRFRGAQSSDMNCTVQSLEPDFGSKLSITTK